jgi:hypothetical protein
VEVSHRRQHALHVSLGMHIALSRPKLPIHVTTHTSVSRVYHLGQAYDPITLVNRGRQVRITVVLVLEKLVHPMTRVREGSREVVGM